MSSDVRWIRSYVVQESDGGLGTFCVYQASSPEKIHEHAERAGIPATDIFEVADTVVVRPDPVPAAA
ncbi:MAG: nickel-binding protein [Gaiellaceae bacterium]